MKEAELLATQKKIKEAKAIEAEKRAEAKKAGQNYQEWRKEQKNIYGSGGGNTQKTF